MCVCGSKEENKHTRIFFYMKINISSERCFRFIRRACDVVVIHFAEYYAVETKPTAPTPPHHPHSQSNQSVLIGCHLLFVVRLARVSL